MGPDEARQAELLKQAEKEIPQLIRDSRGRLYQNSRLDGIQGTLRRQTPKGLSKKERAKLKRRGVQRKMGITLPSSARIGGFFA